MLRGTICIRSEVLLTMYQRGFGPFSGIQVLLAVWHSLGQDPLKMLKFCGSLTLKIFGHF